jgi:hypothetical protein
MKNIIITLAAAMICITSCKKQPTPAPASVVHSEVITEADFNGSKATQVIRQNKKTGEGLEMDYDIVIKQVSEKKYVAAMKFNGLTLNGKNVKGSKDVKIYGAELSLKTGKNEDEVPDIATLMGPEINTSSNSPIITFPAFEYSGDLTYAIVSPSGTIIVNSDLTISNGLATVNISDLNIVADKSSLNGGNLEIKENSNVVISGMSVPVNFGISISEKDRGKCRLTNSTSLFVLPSGHTVVQEPLVSKVKVQDDNAYMVVTISGDPAMAIKTVYYQPEPIEGREQPAMKFEATHYNMKNGIQRFRSTQTWEQVYGKATPPKWNSNASAIARVFIR